MKAGPGRCRCVRLSWFSVNTSVSLVLSLGMHTLLGAVRSPVTPLGENKRYVVVSPLLRVTSEQPFRPAPHGRCLGFVITLTSIDSMRLLGIP